MENSGKKRPFFRADMAGLGKYSMGGYGRIGVYRVKFVSFAYALNRQDILHFDWLAIVCSLLMKITHY